MKKKEKNKQKIPFKERFKTRCTKIWKWLRKNIINKEMIVFALIGELIFWSPAIILGIIAFFETYFWAICSAYIAFWAMPITPAIPIQLLIIFGLKKIYDKIKIKKKKEEKNDGSKQISDR